MVETLTEELIRMDLATLSHGGEEAIRLFLEMSKRLHEDDADCGLHHWVTVAAPALPERERNKVTHGPGCLNRFSASLSGTSAVVRLPSGRAAD